MATVNAYRNHLVRRGLTEATIAKRTRALRLLEATGPLLDHDHHSIGAFLDARVGRNGPLDPRTRVCWLSHLHCFYQWAIAEDLTDRDPTARLMRPKLRRRLPRPIPDAIYMRAVDDAPTALLRAWLLLAGNAGLRCCEIARLRGEDVTVDGLRVTGKGGRDRVVPMHPRLVAVAATWPSEGHVFVDAASGLPYLPGQVSRLIGDYFRRAGLPYRAHQARHRFASAVYEATGDLNVVAELCGHESIETTRIYAALSPHRRRHAVSLIP